MNRFKTKRRAKDDTSGGNSFMAFRKGKKSTEEPRKEFDLKAALPSNDDFRTSLLMTNLSARFSMLREQDDPSTKIGKASDDSVLFPRRHSRLMDFGYGGGLSDIAEVESLRAPPTLSRADSFLSDDASFTKPASIMDRAKPLEGNNLFGGRQKIYKIPIGSNSSKALVDGTMGGRAVYEDDIALSSFQLWRQAQKPMQNVYDEDDIDHAILPKESAEALRSESPSPFNYNRRRETSSTISSGFARNSTAATSFTSQPIVSAKDWHSTSAGPPSSTSTPHLDRGANRARRLYEQGLTQDLQEQQTSALSRIDILTRQRYFGSRTPDTSQTSPSPTVPSFGDRFGGEKRQLITKSSAPNLRSISPPATGSSTGTADFNIRVPGPLDTKNSFGGMPPLSPPISEVGDHPMLPIRPSDRGKATAMGVFSKPVQPYDETRFAQRQLQLQHGRATPLQRARGESDASSTSDQSRYSSGPRQSSGEANPETSLKVVPARRKDESAGSTFLYDSDEGSQCASPVSPVLAPVTLERSPNKKHLAREDPTMPGLSTAGSATADAFQAENPAKHSPSDSPTLGPVTTGLSGLVRQHLRTESNTSSNYGTGDSAYRTSIARDLTTADRYGTTAESWTLSEQDWTLSYYGGDQPETLGPRQNAAESLNVLAMTNPQDSSPAGPEKESDEFASQLANARQRVRERLITYADSDSGCLTTSHRMPEPPKDSSSQTQKDGSSPLRPKSSRGSLIDRSRSIVGQQSKAMKMLGIGVNTISSLPSSNKLALEERESSVVESMPKEPIRPAMSTTDNAASKSETDSPTSEAREDDDAHPGLRAFRQARRELQKRKELETLARHQVAQTSQAASPLGDESACGHTPASHSSSPQSSADRNPSGSGTSSGRSGSRPARLQSNSTPHGDQQMQLTPNSIAPQARLRSPGLPGTDIRHSPIMPPQPYKASNTPATLPSPNYFDRTKPATKLNLQPNWTGYESVPGQLSPMTPLSGLPPSPHSTGANSGTSTPTISGPVRSSPARSPVFGGTTSTLDETLKRHVDKSQISEPTFIMSTSRVPTVNLPHSLSSPELTGPRARSESKSGYTAPPLPPINPRRRQESSGSPHGGVRRNDIVTSTSSPNLALEEKASKENGTSSGIGSRAGPSVNDEKDDGSSKQRRPVRKAMLDDKSPVILARFGAQLRTASPPFIATGPPASRAMLTQGPGGMI